MGFYGKDFIDLGSKFIVWCIGLIFFSAVPVFAKIYAINYIFIIINRSLRSYAHAYIIYNIMQYSHLNN